MASADKLRCAPKHGARPVSARRGAQGGCPRTERFRLQEQQHHALLERCTSKSVPRVRIPPSRNPSDQLYTSEDFWKKGIGIVTVHRAQQAAIITLLEQAFPETDPGILRGAVDTVERFQGQQRDIIFGSYAVGDPDTIGQEEEFLLSLNRFNVTTSRARTKVVLFLTRSLVNHIAAEVEQIHQSAMIKEFVDLYCDQKSVGQLHWINDQNQAVAVPGILHAKAFAAGF